MGSAVTFEVDSTEATERVESLADRIRRLAAAGAPAQPAPPVAEPVLAPTWTTAVAPTIPRVGDCAPCLAAALAQWEATRTVDWAALTLTADGSPLVVIDAANPGRFVAILCVEEERTADNRIIAANATKWRDPPLPIMLMTKTADGHDGAEVAGVIEHIIRHGAKIIGEGRFDTGAAGIEAARLVANKILTGVSIDAGDVEGDIVVEAVDENGSPTDAVARMTALTVLGSTICPFQAIGGAFISYVSPDGTMSQDDLDRFGIDPELFATAEELAVTDDETLTAAGPRTYPAALFSDPKLAALTPIATEPVEGSDDLVHVYGHAAPWQGCHISFPGTCVTPPRSRTNYSHFLTGSVRLDDNTVQPVGTIALNTKHADHKLGPRETAQHYDHTGLAAAFVNVGEDEFGIWVSGVMRPGLDENDATILAASSLSGDWRNIGGNLELVALLSVNTPGFPIAHRRDDVQLSLVAAGYGHIAPGEHGEAAAPIRQTVELFADKDAVTRFSAELAALIEEQLTPLRTEIARLTADARPARREAVLARLAGTPDVVADETFAGQKPHEFVDEDGNGKCDVCGMAEGAMDGNMHPTSAE